MAGNNKAIIRRLVTEAWTGENFELVDEFVSPDYYEHAPFGDVTGIEGYKEGIAMFNEAFAGIALEIGDMVAEGDRVAFRFTFSGRHTGEFMGIPASDRQVSIEGIDITRLENGQVVEEWLSLDMFGLMEQISD